MESAESPETVPRLLTRELIESGRLKQHDTFIIDGENSSFKVLNIDSKGDMFGITAERVINPDANPEITTYTDNFPFIIIHFNLRDNKYHYIGREQQSSIAQGPFRQRNGGKRKRTKKKRGGDEENKDTFTFDDLFNDNADSCVLRQNNCNYIGKKFHMISPSGSVSIHQNLKYIGVLSSVTQQTLIFQRGDNHVYFSKSQYGSYKFKLLPERPRLVAGGPKDDLKVISDFISEVSLRKDIEKIKQMIEDHDETIGIVNYVGKSGDTVLHYMYRFAVHLDKKDLDIIKLLIDKGIDVNHKNNIGNTVLHMIANDTDFVDYECTSQEKIDLVCKIIILLRNLGANVNIVNNAGQSPIVLAVIHNACADIQSAFTRHLEGAINAINATPETLYEDRMTFPRRATLGDISAEPY